LRRQRKKKSGKKRREIDESDLNYPSVFIYKGWKINKKAEKRKATVIGNPLNSNGFGTGA
jgi:hypothetical protein